MTSLQNSGNELCIRSVCHCPERFFCSSGRSTAVKTSLLGADLHGSAGSVLTPAKTALIFGGGYMSRVLYRRTYFLSSEQLQHRIFKNSDAETQTFRAAPYDGPGGQTFGSQPENPVQNATGRPG
jgi:hypothetical protein